MILKKSTILFLIFSFLICLNVQAVPALKPANVEKFTNGYLNTNNQKIAYSINIPAKKMEDGTFSAPVTYYIQQLDPQFFYSNLINIKTKNRTDISSGSKSFYSSVLMATLQDYSIQNIRSPYSNLVYSGKLKSFGNGLERIYEIQYSSTTDPYELCKELMKNPEIEYAVPVFRRYEQDYTPNDPKISSQWAVTKIQLQKAWGITKGSKSVVIGIVDSGVDWTHEDLGNNIWINPGEDGVDSHGNDKRTNGIDDDGDGKIDDWHGWDLVGNVSDQQAANGQFLEDNDPKNLTGFHGTHVAGCASAATDNGVGIAGTGFNCSILPVKCATDVAVDGGIYRGFDGIAYAVAMGADIINCSWGGPGFSPAEQDVINSVIAKGCVFVAAAGNNGAFIDNGGFYPACYDNVLRVGSSGAGDKISNFSNYGMAVTVYSPGENIYSTLPSNNYGNQSGTSMASPIVAGVCGLIKSLHPTWTPKQILTQVRNTSDNVLTTDSTQRPYLYGRVDAYKAVDYNYTPGKTIAGMQVDSIVIKGGTALTSYDQTIVTFYLKNYLADASNLKMLVTPQNNYLSIQQTNFTIGNIPANGVKTLTTVLQLTPMNPWFSGSANLLLTFTGDNYMDYQLVKIPINIQSNNTYTNVTTFPDTYEPTWNGASSPTGTTCWAVGQGGLYGQSSGGYFRQSGNSPTYAVISTEVPYCIFGFDDLKAVLGTGTSSSTSATLYSTTDGGQTWAPKSVSNITGFINGINYFDNNNGIFLGDPKTGVWGIAKTPDGGQNWQQVQNVPAPQTSETGLVGSIFWQGQNGWFGTTTGRVFATNNGGSTWKAGAISGAVTVTHVGFADSLHGMAVYTQSSTQTTPIYMATTIDGGATWTANKANFTQEQLYPIYFFNVKNSYALYMLCSQGEVYSTNDNGATWNSILNLSHGAVGGGASFSLGGSRANLWNLGATIGYLNFGYLPSNPVKKLQAVPTDTLVFDSVDIGKIQTKPISIEDIGNVEVQTQFTIQPDNAAVGEFSIFLTPPSIVEPGAPATIRIKFLPQQEGLRTATLKLSSDAQNGEMDFQLVGYGRAPASVGDEQLSNFSFDNIVPNPVNDKMTISFNMKNQVGIKLDILNTLGMTVKSFYTGEATVGQNILQFNVGDIPAGVYFVVLDANGIRLNKQFVIIR